MAYILVPSWHSQIAKPPLGSSDPSSLARSTARTTHRTPLGPTLFSAILPGQCWSVWESQPSSRCLLCSSYQTLVVQPPHLSSTQPWRLQATSNLQGINAHTEPEGRMSPSGVLEKMQSRPGDCARVDDVGEAETPDRQSSLALPSN